MNERVVVPSGGLRLSNRVAPNIVEVFKPPQGQAVALDLHERRATTLDFSAIADEKLNLVQDGARLVVEFDNQSTVIAEPFFDLSGKPLPYLEVEFGGVRAMSNEQLSALLGETVGQPTGTDEDKIPPSGANFIDASVDLLPGGVRPLALLQPESHKSSLADIDNGTNLHALQQNLAPIITIPSPGGAATLVFEGGLLSSRGPGESAGSHAGSPAFPVATRPGTISFTSPDGVQSVSLGGHALTTSPQTFTDATGSLTASYSFDAATHRGAINYTSPQTESRRVLCSDDTSSFLIFTRDKNWSCGA